MIRLGFCLDLLDPYNVKRMMEIHEEYCKVRASSGGPIPANLRHRRFLDCAVFQYAYAAIESADDGQPVDTARAVYLEESDADEPPQDTEVAFEPEDWAGGQASESDADGGSHPAHGRGEADDPGGSRPGEAASPGEG